MSGDNQDQNQDVSNATGGAEDSSTHVDSSYLEMSDDEISNMSFPEPVAQEDDNSSDDSGDDDSTDDQNDNIDNQGTDGDDSASDDGDDDSTDDDDNSEADNENDESDDDASNEDPDGDDNSQESDQNTDGDDDQTSDSDAQKMLNQLFAPFKANGRDISVNNIEDARRLMQMGANYNKKMQSLKPHLKIVKMLDNNDLLDESKLNLAIEVMKGNPEAISKLLKDKGVDTLTLDTDKADSYQEKDHTVGDAQVVMEEVLDNIKHSPSYGRTLNIVKNELDEVSRNALLTSPEAIQIINAHVESGLYDQVMNIVESKRVLGELPSSLSDLDAYKMVGKQLQDRQSQQANSNANTGQGQRQSTEDVEKTKKREMENQRKSRKKAAGSPANTKGGGKKAEQKFDPLAMGDAEFEQMAAKLGF